MNSTKRKRRVSHLFYGRLYSSKFFWQSAEDSAWNNMAPIGGEFGSPDYDRLMAQDWKDLKSNLSKLIEKFSDSGLDRDHPLDPTEHQHAVNVKIAFHELGHDVSVSVAAAVWRHYSNSLMADWMSGAETVKSAKRTLLAYCTRRPTEWTSFALADWWRGKMPTL